MRACLMGHGVYVVSALAITLGSPGTKGIRGGCHATISADDWGIGMRLLGILLCMALLAGGCSALEGDATPDVEALRPKAAEITDLLVKNEWKAVRKGFDSTMEKALSEDGLANAWASVVKEKGAYVSHGEPTQIPKPGNVTVFDTPMTFERGEMKSRVTLRPNGEIAGLFILIPEAN